jgi:hypothetical protein
VNIHARFPETVGFGAPVGIDPHCIEVHVPPGNSGEIRIIEQYGVAAGAFGQPIAERCSISRKRWYAIRDDVKRHFNERLKEKNVNSGSWKTGVNKVERLLGQELLVLCWAVEAAELALAPIAVRNWLALRPEERWWLFAVTAAATGEAKHREIGWRKALRFALTENPVREALARAEPNAPSAPSRRKAKPRVEDPSAPCLPGFEEAASPVLVDASHATGDITDVHEERDAGTVFVEEHAIADRARDPGPEDLSGSAKRKKGRSKPDANGSRELLEGPKAPRARKGMRTRRAATSDG